MTALNNGFGATRFPAPSVSSAVELDPGHDALLGLLQTAINADLGEAWRGIVSSLNANHWLVRESLTQPVGYASNVEIAPQQMMQFKAAWPLLAVYRQGEPELFPITTHYDGLRQEWSVDYVIGPLDVGYETKIGRFCVAVARCVQNVIRHGYHPEFDGGKRQFYGQFSEIRVKSVQGPGVAQAMTEEQGSGYYGMTITIETVERDVFDGYAATDAFETITGHVAVGTETATELTESWIDIDTENGTPVDINDEPGT